MLPIVLNTGGGRGRVVYKRRKRYGKTIKYKTWKNIRRQLNAAKAVRKEMKDVPPYSEPPTEAMQYRRALVGATYKDAPQTQKNFRRALRYYGAGDYTSDWKPWLQKWVPKGSMAALGGWAGGLAGGPAGSTLGAGIGHLASNYFGWGDYCGDAGGNQIMGGADKSVRVNVDSMNDDVYLSHREFLGNVQASAAIPNGASTAMSTFTLTAYPINAGLAGTFPWLAQIANNFTMYELIGCIFEYKPTSGEFGTTGQNALGKVVMATQYDPDAPNFVSSVQMENYAYNNTCKPSEHAAHGVETALGQRATNMLYVRNGPSAKDKIFTDVGVFQIATENIPLSGAQNTTVTSNIGELWVTYRVKLSRAQLFSTNLNSSVPCDLFVGYTSGTPGASQFQSTIARLPTKAFGPSWNITGLLPTQAAPKYSNNIGCVLTSANDQTIKLTFPTGMTTGTFYINVLFVATNIATTYANSILSVSASSGLSQANGVSYGGDPVSPYPIPITPTTTQAIGSVSYSTFVSLSTTQASPSSITFSWNAAPDVDQSCFVYVIGVPKAAITA